MIPKRVMLQPETNNTVVQEKSFVEEELLQPLNNNTAVFKNLNPWGTLLLEKQHL